MPKWSNTRAGVKRWPADKWFSLCVRHAAGNQCESCGAEATDCAHIYGRRNYATRWCKDNAIALCRRCHDAYGKEPIEWVEFIDGQWPGRRDDLRVKRRGILKNTEANRALISKHYNQELRRMERDGTREFESWN